MVHKVTLDDLTFSLIKDLETKTDKNYNIGCLGTEVSFADNKRRADVVVVADNNDLIAFEIKSDYDNLTRLEAQIKDYIKCFDYTYVVITEKYKSAIVKYENIGILIYSDGEMFVFRKAKKNKLKKRHICSFISDKDESIKTKNIQDIKNLAANSLKDKLLPLYNDFKDNFYPPYDKQQIITFCSKRSLKYYSGY